MARRFGQLVLVLVAVTFLSFAALSLIGDPLVNVVGVSAAAAENHDCDAIVAEAGRTGAVVVPPGADYDDGTVADCREVVQARERYHLDENLLVRYGRYVTDLAQGDLGRSFVNGEEVRTIIGTKAPETALLVVLAQLVALVVAIPWGIRAAYRANRAFDKASSAVSFGFVAIPGFALGVILLYLFAIRWSWFPVAYDDTDVGSRLRSLVLPSVTLGLPLAATYQRLLRTDLVTTLQEDFIVMARAKGMPDRWVMIRHALRPSMASVVTLFGINTGVLCGGSLVVERIFQINGLGSAVAEAVIADDFPLVLAVVVVVAVAFVVINFFVDLAYALVDPRVRMR